MPAYVLPSDPQARWAVWNAMLIKVEAESERIAIERQKLAREREALDAKALAGEDVAGLQSVKNRDWLNSRMYQLVLEHQKGELEKAMAGC